MEQEKEKKVRCASCDWSGKPKSLISHKRRKHTEEKHSCLCGFKKAEEWELRRHQSFCKAFKQQQQQESKEEEEEEEEEEEPPSKQRKRKEYASIKADLQDVKQQLSSLMRFLNPSQEEQGVHHEASTMVTDREEPQVTTELEPKPDNKLASTFSRFPLRTKNITTATHTPKRRRGSLRQTNTR